MPRQTSLPAAKAPSPDVIARVTAAKTVFLSNAGANDYFNGQIPGGPNVAYNELYAALQQWGYFHLVDSPAHADLIFQIRGTEIMPSSPTTASVAPSPTSTPPTSSSPSSTPTPTPPTPPPSTPSPSSPAAPTTSPKATSPSPSSIEWLTYQISKLVNVPPSPPPKLKAATALRPSFETLIDYKAPVPPQVLNAKNIYLADEDHPNAAHPNDPYFQAFQTALTTWGHYHLVDSPSDADVVFHYHNDPTNGISVTITASRQQHHPLDPHRPPLRLLQPPPPTPRRSPQPEPHQPPEAAESPPPDPGRNRRPPLAHRVL